LLFRLLFCSTSKWSNLNLADSLEGARLTAVYYNFFP